MYMYYDRMEKERVVVCLTLSSSDIGPMLRIFKSRRTFVGFVGSTISQVINDLHC